MKYSNNFESIYRVFLTLTDKEKLYICSGEFKDSPYVKYRNCIIDKNDAVGFIEVYNLPDEKYEFIVIAINPKYRGKGISIQLLDKMFDEYNNKYDYMWRCDKKNFTSNYLAKKYGFKLFHCTNTKNEYILCKSTIRQ